MTWYVFCRIFSLGSQIVKLNWFLIFFSLASCSFVGTNSHGMLHNRGNDILLITNVKWISTPLCSAPSFLKAALTIVTLYVFVLSCFLMRRHHVSSGIQLSQLSFTILQIIDIVLWLPFDFPSRLHGKSFSNHKLFSQMM